MSDYSYLDEMRTHQLKAIQKIIKCKFRNIDFLNQSLTHKSYANECKDKNIIIQDNERLEFLGDAILSYILTDFLMEKFPDYSEGMLSKLRAHIVSEKILAAIAGQNNLGDYLLLGKGEESSGGRTKKSILANCLEALLAGVYLDQGLEAVKKFIIKNFQLYIEEIAQSNFIPDFKTILQEYTQGKLNCTPTYKVTNQNGLDHEKVFEVNLIINKKSCGFGEGRSKKEAEQKAAYQALKNMKIDGIKLSSRQSAVASPQPAETLHNKNGDSYAIKLSSQESEVRSQELGKRLKPPMKIYNEKHEGQ